MPSSTCSTLLSIVVVSLHTWLVFQFVQVSICVPLDKRPNYFATHPVPPQVVYKDGLPQLRAALNPDSYDSNEEIDPEGA